MNPKQEALKRICDQYEILILYAFGSRADEAWQYVQRGIPLKEGPSDLDIGVLPAQPLHVKQKVTLTIALEDFFNVNRVDLVVIPEAGPFLAANIIRGERLYAKDSRQADEYDLYILRRAGDLAFFEQERMKLTLRVKE
jgi:predicted nucleotidyltransferase